MDIIFSNVSIDKMTFNSRKLSIKLDFINTLINNYRHCGSIICNNIYMLKIESNEEEVELPSFICEVRHAVIKGDNKKCC